MKIPKKRGRPRKYPLPGESLLQSQSGGHTTPTKASGSVSPSKAGSGENKKSIHHKIVKLKKDSNAPQRPPNPYLLFLRQIRPKMRDSHPDLSYTDVVKLCATEWLKLTDDEKKPYVDAAESDRLRYIKEAEEYRKSAAYSQYRQAKKEAAMGLVSPRVEGMIKKRGRPRKHSISGEGESLLSDGHHSAGSSPVKKPKLMIRSFVGKDSNAPHKPRNPFLIFLRHNRPKMIAANPNTLYTDVIKLAAAQWVKMSDEEKKPYVEEAEKDRQRYHREIKAYRESGAYKAYRDSVAKAKLEVQKKEKKLAGKSQVLQPGKKKLGRPPKNATLGAKATISKKAPSPVKGLGRPPTVGRPTGRPAAASKLLAKRADHYVSSTTITSIVPSDIGDIPIFTEQFLEHNKAREMELRKLRKLTTEYEEQNAILSKHLDNMREAELRLKKEMAEMRSQNEAIERYMDQMRRDFVTTFTDVPIPGTNEYPTLETVDEYITKLYDRMVASKSFDRTIQDRVNQFIHAFANSIEPES